MDNKRDKVILNRPCCLLFFIRNVATYDLRVINSILADDVFA